MTVALRPVEPSDRPFLERVYASTRAEELAVVDWNDEQKTAFLRQQFDAQNRDYRANYAAATFDVILVDGEPAGRLYVDRRADEITILDIALLPEHRGRGVGTSLLEALLAEARASDRAVMIYVERFNPAQRLYGRLGFELAEEGPVYLLMRWRPAAAAS